MNKSLTILSLALALVCAGCSTSTVVRTGKDGESFTFHNTRFFWKSANVTGKVTPQGMSFSVATSGVDAEAIGTAAGIAAATALKTAGVPAAP